MKNLKLKLTQTSKKKESINSLEKENVCIYK